VKSGFDQLAAVVVWENRLSTIETCEPGFKRRSSRGGGLAGGGNGIEILVPPVGRSFDTALLASRSNGEASSVARMTGGSNAVFSDRFVDDSQLEGDGFEPVWGFSCQVVFLVCWQLCASSSAI
jgi:hypothetical protein